MFGDFPVLVRGGGDIGTGVVMRLHRAGFPVIVCELDPPLTVRRQVAVSTAVTEGVTEVEDLEAVRVEVREATEVAAGGRIPVVVGESLPDLDVTVVVDARLAKRNIDTSIEDAPLVVGLGPGFTAGEDCHAVVETMRGHTLGRVYWEGTALPDTGQPGVVRGRGGERVLRAPARGLVHWSTEIGELVAEGEVLGHIVSPQGRFPITSPFTGLVRGQIAERALVAEGYKVGDVDPRTDLEDVHLVSDKALSVGGGVLEAVLVHLGRVRAGSAPEGPQG
ncbi:MAG TPA: EF2563 family selenium-dependent molybdenum hydroxylase system protein [Acidimicrobiales bacterium]|nr:EF2563 family selenium-dependent molybdenum hydroxylase system protein [Acidimicrobiales bacterium]